MAYKQFGAGDVLTAADMNTYLMNQAVIDCTSGTRPSTFRVIYETDTTKLLVKQGSAVRRIPMDSESGGPWTNFQAANDTSGSQVYGAGANNNAVSFVAPPSGKVYIAISASLGTNAITSAGSWLSFEIRTGSTIGSGTVTLAADDTRGVSYQPNNPTAGFKYAPAHVRVLVATGLTADSTYHARSMFRSDTSGSTSAVLNRTLLVEPVL